MELLHRIFNKRARSTSKIKCPRLESKPEHDQPDTWPGLFQQPPLPLTQTWLEQPHDAFQAGHARMGWHGNALYVWAELEDRHTQAWSETHNQPLWQLGDTLEFFVSDDSKGHRYYELHVNPNGHRLQLYFPHSKAFREDNSLQRHAVEKSIFDSFVTHHEHGWGALLRVDGDTLFGKPGDLAGQVWYFSICRYDYAGPESPAVHSSTSPHQKLGFHQTQEWHSLQFV
jgi:hypothetical protein